MPLPHTTITVPATSNATVDIKNAAGETIFHLVLHTNSDYPSVDVIRKANGRLVARSMHDGKWTLDEPVVGNYTVIAVLILE